MEKGKKGVFIVSEGTSLFKGVNKKIYNQVSAFTQEGIGISFYEVKNKKIFGYKILHRLPFTNLSPVWKVEKSLFECDFIYLRKPFGMNMPFINFLKIIKKNQPNIKIIMEIPTYPYDKEMTESLRNWPFYIKEIFARRKLKNYIDIITLLTNDKEVFGVKTLKIKNGFDFTTTRARKFDINKKAIDIVLVAIFCTWHGFERLIKGLYLYYKNGNKRQVNLHFIGDGAELSTYKKLVLQYKLNKYVKFYGMQDKENIEKIYDRCDIGASSFGLYKKNLEVSCDLKSREYLSAGLPIICGGKMDIMEYPDLKEYILEFPNNSSDVSIEKIVKFYDKIYKNKTKEEIDKIINHIRNIAIENLNMQKAMREVLDYIHES